MVNFPLQQTLTANALVRVTTAPTLSQPLLGVTHFSFLPPLLVLAASIVLPQVLRFQTNHSESFHSPMAYVYGNICYPSSYLVGRMKRLLIYFYFLVRSRFKRINMFRVPFCHTPSSSWFPHENLTYLLSNTLNEVWIQPSLSSYFKMNWRSSNKVLILSIVHCFLSGFLGQFAKPLDVNNSSRCHKFPPIIAHLWKATIDAGSSSLAAYRCVKILYNEWSKVKGFKSIYP